MKDLGFFLGFFAIIIFFAVVASSGKGLFSDFATSTPRATDDDATYSAPGTAPSPSGDSPSSGSGASERQPTPQAQPAKPKLTPEQMERKVADIFRQLDRLSEEVRKLKLREPVSPYAGLVTLSTGSARSTDPEREYLVLRAQSSNKEPVSISDWYIESYVTEERAALPSGDRIIERWRRPSPHPIELLPGESAYVLTGESPIDVSFHENICTGYLADEKNFYPSLRRSCPRPINEMERFANIPLDDDTCYDFVERLSSCRVVDDSDYEDVDLSGRCRTFIDNTLNYDDCVAKHRYDPFFDNVGDWHLYLERDEDLWRYEREILRLMDENDRVIAVVEY